MEANREGRPAINKMKMLNDVVFQMQRYSPTA